MSKDGVEEIFKMLLYLAEGPSSRVVEIFLIESGLKVKKKFINLIKEENLQQHFLKLNPLGQVPCLNIGNNVICESVAICEYLDRVELSSSGLFGRTEIENALISMWQRRIDLYIWGNIYYSYQSSIGLEIFKTKILTLPKSSNAFTQVANDRLKIFNDQLKKHPWIGGDYFSICDISLFSILDFGLQNKQPFDSSLLRLNVWYSTMMTRNSTHESKLNLEKMKEL